MADVLDQAKKNIQAKTGSDKPADTMNKSLQTGAPAAIVGEFGNDSRGFSLSKFAASTVNRNLGWENAKLEKAVSEKFEKSLKSSGQFLSGADTGGTWLPQNLDYFGDALDSSTKSDNDIKWIKGVMNAGASRSVDPDEVEWMIKKGMFKKATDQQAYVDGYGGSLVAPPTQGETIPLIRPDAACLAAGASQMALPPSGRYVEPRITSAPTATGVEERGDPLQSDMGTDVFQLTAKKIVSLVKITDEATMFTSGAMDNWVRSEMNRTMGLQFDAYAMYGPGGTTLPAGITSATYSGTNQVIDFATTYSTARGIGTDGNVLLPQYCDGFEALIGERSFNMDSAKAAYIMRPGVWGSVTAARADAVTPGDQAGPRVDILRQTQEKAANQWATRKVVRSTNVKGNLTKGAGTNLSDVFYGIWNYMVFATYGAVNFQDQYVGTDFNKGIKTLKATMYGDVGLRYPGAFLWYTKVRGVSMIF